MNTSEQRRQWAEHIADEGRALQRQQEAAGTTHSPREGPLPHTAEQLEAAVAAAVAGERQRCAALAEAWSAEPRLLETLGDLTEGELHAAAATARGVAAEIRGATAHRLQP
jgi:hypothetical protein